MLDDDDDVDLLGADISILPPTGRHDDTDGDSGDDNVPDGDPNNLNYHQLIAEAAVRLRKPDGDIILGLDDEFDALEESDKCKTRISRKNKSKHTTMKKLEYNSRLKAPVAESSTGTKARGTNRRKHLVMYRAKQRTQLPQGRRLTGHQKEHVQKKWFN